MIAYLDVCKTELRILGLLMHSRRDFEDFGLAFGASLGFGEDIDCDQLGSLKVWKSVRFCAVQPLMG